MLDLSRWFLRRRRTDKAALRAQVPLSLLGAMGTEMRRLPILSNKHTAPAPMTNLQSRTATLSRGYDLMTS